MVKKFEITSVKYDKLPDIKKSYELLDIIHRKIKPPLSEISHKVNKTLIIYGAGNLGKMAKEYFDKLNVPILFVVDKDPETHLQESFWKNNKTEIINPEDVPTYLKKSATFVICVVTDSYYNVTLQLRKKGFLDLVPFYDIALLYQDKQPLQNGWITGLLDDKDKEGIEFVLSNLQDDISCAHYLQFIAWHAYREEWIFKDAPISNDNRYFIPEIVDILTDNETFIDIGAHHGEVITKFMNITNNNFNKAVAIEPDKENISIFLDTMKERMNDYNISLITKALGEKQETKKFYHGLGYSSQLSDLSDDNIEVKKLDDLNINPTLIKIHSEGCENEIIKGGLDTIIKNRPIIVTTSYHNRNGLWKLPLTLINSLENYIYYFRLHSWCGTGAVIYAIPKERLNDK